MKIHVSMPIFSDRDSRPFLKKCLDLGVSVEVWLWQEVLDNFEPKDLSWIKEELEKQGLSLSVHAPWADLSPGGLDNEVRKVTQKRFNQTLRFCEVLEPQNVVFHTGWYPGVKAEGGLLELWVKRSLEIWVPLFERAKKSGFKISIENTYEEDPVLIKELIKDQEGIGFCLDVGHVNVFGGKDHKRWLEELGSSLFEVHLHDNHGFYDEHLPLGEGIIDFQKLFSMFPEKDDLILTLEVFEPKGLKRSLEFLKNFSLKGPFPSPHKGHQVALSRQVANPLSPGSETP